MIQRPYVGPTHVGSFTGLNRVTGDLEDSHTLKVLERVLYAARCGRPPSPQNLSGAFRLARSTTEVSAYDVRRGNALTPVFTKVDRGTLVPPPADEKFSGGLLALAWTAGEKRSTWPGA